MNEDTKGMKPCPFCQNTRNVEPRQDRFGLWYVFCPLCRSRGPDFIMKSNAIEFWNRRPQPEEQAEGKPQ